MDSATTSEREIGNFSDRIRLVPAENRSDALQGVEAQGFLHVDVPAPGPALRGRLALLLESAIEEALERRGAVPPGVDASTDLNASLGDQLYRARQVGASGLALWLPHLVGIANLASALDAEDSAVLRWWIAAAADRPVRLLVDDRNRRLAVYGIPTELGPLVSRVNRGEEPSAAEEPAPFAAPEAAASAAAARAAPRPERTTPRSERELACRMEQLVLDLAALPLTDEEVPDSAEVEDQAESAPTEVHTAPDVSADSSETSEAAQAADDSASSEAESPTAEPEPIPDLDIAEPLTAELTAGSGEEPSPAAKPSTDVDDEDAEPGPAAAPARREPAPLQSTAQKEWRSWMRDLDASRGPKSLAAVERLFVTRYVPLSDAVSCKVADPAARQVLDSWSDSFARSYLDAFNALRMRGKRPTMVLDVPDLALRIARLHGARSVQLLVVDGMRFDVGLRMHEYLRPLLDQRAVLTERLLLWAALPTTTAVQLELLRRGPEGLRELNLTNVTDIPPARGYNASTLRRLKSGQRELLKLDVIESRLAEPGGSTIERLDRVAEDAANAIAGYMLNLAQPSLVMVFGDHGFTIEEHEDRTDPAAQGGASPDEVLVPAFAWVVGQIH